VNQPPPSRALTAGDIAEYLETADDFAFEREVYHVAHELLFHAEHAALYSDPVTGKQRQFDVRASHSIQDREIALAIECKGLTIGYPLLVSCVPRAENEAYHDVLQVSEPSDPVAYAVSGAMSLARVTQVVSERNPCLYPPGQGVGKSMRQVRRETKGERKGQMVSGDEVFDKWTQAVASLAEMIENGARQLGRGFGPYQKLRYIAFLPVLVVPDETLWVADYSSHGQLRGEPFQVPELSYYLGRQYPLVSASTALTITHLHIITRSRVRPWLEGIAHGGGIWQELFPSE
jgi:hypothetical protein